MTILTMEAEVETYSSHSGALARDWVAVATRAHAILTQSLPDDLLDEMPALDVADQMPFTLPAALVG
jgi:hypothetical protein